MYYVVYCLLKIAKQQIYWLKWLKAKFSKWSIIKQVKQSVRNIKTFFTGATRNTRMIHLLDNVKIGNLKKKNRDHKKYLNKMKILVTCKFYYI